MRYTKEENGSRKVIALGLATLYTLKGYRHVNYSCYENGADVTVFVDTKEEAEKAKQDSLMNLVDGCASEIREWDTKSGHYFTYCVEY